MSLASATIHADCMIAMRHSSGVVLTYFSDSRFWEPHPDFTEAAMN